MRESPRARWKPCALLALAALWCVGCAPRQVRPGEYQAWVNGFGFGLFGTSELDVRDVCESGRARRVAVEQTATTTLVTVLSFGLYSPRQVRIRCRQ